jgi:hypothetical protein
MKDNIHNLYRAQQVYKSHNRYNRDDINTYIQLCDINYEMVEKYEKLYNDNVGDWNFDSVYLDGTNKINTINESFSNDSKYIENKCIHDMTMIYDNVEILYKKIYDRIKDAGLNPESSEIKSDPVIRNLIKNAELEMSNRCKKTKGNFKQMFSLFYEDYDRIKDIIKLDEYSNIIKPSDDSEFETFLNQSGINFNTDIKKKEKTIEKFGKLKRAFKKLGRGFKKGFGKIGKGLKKGFNAVKSGIGKGISGIFGALKKIVGAFSKIIKFISGFGKMIGKLFTKIFKTIFGVMLMVFKFIAKELIPLAKILVKFIWKVIKFIPKLVVWWFKLYVWWFKMYFTLIKNYIRCPLIPFPMIIGLFFGLQIYLKFITGLQSPIPPLGILIISVFLTLHQLYYNVEGLIKLQKTLISIIMWAASFVKKPGYKPRNFAAMIEETVPKIAKNIPQIILGIMVALIVFKIIINFIYNKISEYVPLD